MSQATDSTKVGIINVDTGTVNLRGGQRFKLDPTTDNVADSSYTFILSDSKVASRFRGYGAGSSFSSSGGTSTARGTGLFMVASRTLLQKTSATITITGTDSGATATIPVTVAKGT